MARVSPEFKGFLKELSATHEAIMQSQEAKLEGKRGVKQERKIYSRHLDLIAAGLKQGKKQGRIAKEIHEASNHAIATATIKTYINNHFPAWKRNAGIPIDQLLSEAKAIIIKNDAKNSKKKSAPAKTKLLNEPLTTEQSRMVSENLGLIFAALKPGVENRVPLHPLTHEYMKDEGKREELFQEGALGLIKAVQTYRPEDGKLSTHAYFGIRNNVLKYLEKQEKHNKDLSLDQPVKTEKGSTITLGETIPDKKENTQPFTWKHPAITGLQPVFDTTKNKRNLAIYILRYGLGHPLEHIGEQYGLTRERIRQLSNEIHKQLPEELKLQDQSYRHETKQTREIKDH